jgi:hypothetical protein
MLGNSLNIADIPISRKMQHMIDPPKSPLKRGPLIPVPPLLRGARGDRRSVANTNEIGIRYTI